VSWPLTPRFLYLHPFVLFRIFAVWVGAAVVDALDLAGPPAPEPSPRYCSTCLASVVADSTGGSRPHYTPQAADELPVVCVAVGLLAGDVSPAEARKAAGSAGFVRCRGCSALWTWTHPDKVRTRDLFVDRCPSCRSGL